MIRFVVGVAVSVGLSTSAWAAGYAVAPGSKIVYTVVHPMHEVRGVNQKVAGKVDYDPAKPLEFAGLVGKFVQAEWKDFDSGNKNRDANTLSVVNASRFPQITFVIEGIDDAEQTGTQVKGTLRGRIYVNGVKQAVSGPVTLDLADPKAIKAASALATKMTAFNLERPSLMMIRAEDDVKIDIALIFAP